MPFSSRFAHVNLISADWKQLSKFYCDVFGCIPAEPARNMKGEWLDRAVGVRGAVIEGIHLRFPGESADGPTLEIFQYSNLDGVHTPPSANRPGFGHIAFEVDDVGMAREAVLAHGGIAIGETTTIEIPDAGMLTFAYLADPEGNIVEVQRWTVT